MNLHLVDEFDNMENRELAGMPEVCLSSLARLPKEYEAYLNDNFGFRSYFIRWNSILTTKALGISPIQSVILGKDSWLFYRSEVFPDGNTMNDYFGTIPLSRSELLRLQQRLEEDAGELSRNGIIYMIAVAPNKNTIYSEYLPYEDRRPRPNTRLDQFMEHMKRHSHLRILDLREALFRAKSEYPLYWKTDSHWNTYGAYIGYREITRHLSASFPNLHMLSISGGKVVVERKAPGGDLAKMLFMQDMLPEENDTKFSLGNIPETPPLDTLVFRHDSFGDNLYPFITRHFKKVINIAPFAPFKFESIIKEHPDALLHLFTERYLTQAIHGDFFYKENWN